MYSKTSVNLENILLSNRIQAQKSLYKTQELAMLIFDD